MVGARVPPGLIGHWPDGSPAFLSRKPAAKIRPLRLMRGDKNFAADQEARHRVGLAAFYDPRTIALDIFVDNWDKHQGNLIFCPATLEIYSVDYGWVFGLGYRRTDVWKGEGYKEPRFPSPGYEAVKLPLPAFVEVGDLDQDEIIRCAEDIGDLPEDLIEYVVNRAARPYNSAGVDAFASEVSAALIYRRSRVKEWTTNRLKT